MTARKMSVFWGCLILTELITVGLFVGTLIFFQANPFGIYGNFVISLGGMIFGLLAGIGAYPGARMAGVAPSARLYAYVIGATVLALALYHFSLYRLAVVHGDPVAEAQGFLGFLDSTHGDAKFRMSPSADSATDIGSFGYGLLTLDLLWAGFSSIVSVAALKRIPHCANCQTFFRQRAKREVRYSDQADLFSGLAGLPTLSQERVTPQERAEALMELSNHHQVKAKEGATCLSLSRGECPTCHQQSMVEEILVHNGKGFVPVNRIAYHWMPIAAHRTAPIAAPVAHGFGRKGLTG